MIDISIIIPVYDESEENLAKLCAGIKDTFKSTGFQHEIVFVGNLGDPAHCEMLGKFSSMEPVNCVFHDNNKNQSLAYNVGLENSKGKFLILIDADMHENTRDILPIIQELEQGYSFVQGNRLNRETNLLRKFFSKGFNLVVSFVKMERVTDIGCGLIGFPRDVLNHVQSYPGKIKDLVMLIMLNAKPVKKVDIKVKSIRKSKYKLTKLIGYSVYLIDQLAEYFWLTKIKKSW